jgi:hypothetical protein
MLAQDLDRRTEKATFDYLPNGAARSPSLEARVRTSGFRPAHFGRRTAGIVTASGTLTYEKPLTKSRFKGRQGMEALTQMR